MPGIEVAGTVVVCGESVTAFTVGDRVVGLVGGGGLADRVIAHERELYRVLDTLDDRAAAVVSEAFVTAFDALCRQAGLAAGDTVLINGPSGGVGSAAVQIAAGIAANVVASVRTESLHTRVGALGAPRWPERRVRSGS